MAIDVSKEGFQITGRAHGRPVVLSLVPERMTIGLDVEKEGRHISLSLEEWDAVQRCLHSMNNFLPAEERERLLGR